MLGEDTEIDIVGEEPEGQLYKVVTPSGATVWLTPEEETQAVKKGLQAGVTYRLTRQMELEKAAIGAAGTAVGLAIGGFLVGFLLGKK